jgi:holo-[acyl-carrier protein] synthase
MHHIGVDIIEIERVNRVVRKWGGRFLNRVYTEKEQMLCHSVPELAARFAAKEAVMKALGTGISGAGWREIEVLSDRRGKPLIHLHGKARLRAKRLGLDGLEVSLSHCRHYALAVVLGGVHEDS